MRERIELRAQDAVARCLIRRLTVPRIYFDAPWPNHENRVDVLAIDRDGVGDAHVVEIRRAAAHALAFAPKLLTTAEPFRWIAFLRGTEDEATSLALRAEQGLYVPGAAGRIGVIEVVEMGSDLGANIRLSAEHFPNAMYDVAMQFSGSHKAHIQLGG